MKKQSKFLSLVLRHKPETINIILDRAGWTSVKELLSALAKHGRGMTRDELNELVATSDKQRFAFSSDGQMIRANQGHSINIDLDLKESEPPPTLYHGTVARYLSDIYRDGLQKMKRHHVHLSSDVETATKVGGRRGQARILVVNAEAMWADGYKFYVSDNGVWLTDQVPSKYFFVLS